jgi:hypothetical protein
VEPERKLKRAVAVGKELFAPLREYSEPLRSSADAKRSFGIQEKVFKEIEPLDLKVLTPVLENMVQSHPSGGFYLPSEWPQAIDVAMDNIKRKASPGFPLMYQYATNEEALRNMGRGTIRDLVLERLNRIAAAPTEAFTEWSAMELCEAGLCDPIRVFVKSEMHSQRKMDSGKMRLIMSVSLVDQLVERVLYQLQNNAEIDDWESCPSKPGMGLNDEGLSVLHQNFQRMAAALGTDVGGYDWGITQVFLDSEASYRNGQVGAPLYSDTMCARRVRLLGLSVLVFGDGTVVQQIVRGVQKSGSYNTSAGNSHIRVVVDKLIGGPTTKVCAMGDDCVGDLDIPPGELTRQYARYGLDVRVMDRYDSGKMEFCAYRFTPDSVEPVRPVKMLSAFLYNWPPEECYEDRVEALKYELRHSPVQSEILDVLYAVHAELVGGDQ